MGDHFELLSCYQDQIMIQSLLCFLLLGGKQLRVLCGLLFTYMLLM